MLSKLDFVQLRSLAERCSAALQQCAWDCNQIGLMLGRCKRAMIPPLPPHQGHRLRNRGARFVIPRGAAHTGRCLCDQQMSRQRHDRGEAHQRWGGAGKSSILPLALRCPPQLRPRCFPGHCHRPATPTPRQPLLAGMLPMRRQPGWRFAACWRVAHPSPAAGHRRLARGIPDRGVRGASDLPWSCPRPIVTRQRAPRRLLVRPHRRQGRAAFPCASGAPSLARGPRRWGIREGGSVPQARDDTATGHPRHPGAPCQGRTTAVRHDDPRAARPPAPPAPEALPGACQHGVLAAPARGLAALGGTPPRQQGQGPDPVGPC